MKLFNFVENNIESDLKKHLATKTWNDGLEQKKKLYNRAFVQP